MIELPCTLYVLCASENVRGQLTVVAQLERKHAGHLPSRGRSTSGPKNEAARFQQEMHTLNGQVGSHALYPSRVEHTAHTFVHAVFSPLGLH